MRTIFVRFYNPTDVMDLTPETSPQEIKTFCFRVTKYQNETDALIAYAETPYTAWSTLLDDTVDIEKFINEAHSHIMMGTKADIDWLEQNFT
jgi:hypothetical protein